MTALPQGEDLGLVEALSKRYFHLGRASANLLPRFAALNRPRLLALTDGPWAARAWRLLGDNDRARRLLKNAERACELAWRWELDGKLEDLKRAVELDPVWKPWLLLAGELEGAEPGPWRSLHLRNMLGKDARLDADFTPTLEWHWRLRSVIRRELGDHEGALADAFEAMRRNEMVGTLFIPLGLYQQELDARGNIEGATAWLKEHPRHWWALVYRSDYKRDPTINENASALEDLLKAVELEPRCAWTWAYLARCQTAMGQNKEAARSLDEAARLDPDCGWIQAWRGEGLRRRGELEEALACFDRAAAIDPDYELIYAWRGGAYNALGRSAEAERDLTVALELEPTTAAWCLHERMSARRRQGKIAEALGDLESAWRINPKFVYENEPRKLSQALEELETVESPASWTWRGDVLMRRREFEAAERALAKAGRGVNALLLRGRALGELDRWSEAEKLFDEALALEPDFPFAAAWRGRARMVRGDLKGAVKDFERALERERNSAWILTWKGEAELKLGRPELAEAELTRALDVHVRYGDAYAWRAMARVRLGREDEAREDVRRALELSPKQPQALELRERLEFGPGELTRLGRHEEAAKAYTALLERKPGDVELLKARAESWRCANRYDLALADLDVLAKKEPARFLASRGEMKRRLLDFNGALRDARAAKSDHLKAEALRNLGRLKEAEAAARRCGGIVLVKVLRQAGKLEAALAACDVDSPYAPAWRGEILRKLGRLEEALEQLELAIKAQPSVAWVRALLGETKRALGLLPEGLADLQEAMRLDTHATCAYDFLGALPCDDPALAWVLAWRGGLKRQRGDRRGAKADLDRARKLDPLCFWIAAWRGELLGDVKELTFALRLFPDYPEAWVWKGRALFESGRAREALACFEEALRREPRQVFAMIGQAACLQKLGRGGAEELLGRARELAPALFA